jgi:tetratricopeptide (TPR) repeat protein
LTIVIENFFQDKFGDTCLHYAVARRNQVIIEKLINECHANVNGGDRNRPSILDILQYNREQQKPFDRTKDDEIERILLSHNAQNRCSIRQVISKRKGSIDNDQTLVSNLASLSLDLTTNGQIETARSHARIAASLQAKGDFDGAQQSYKHAMLYAPDDTLDWATYAFHVAIVHMVHGEQQQALEMLIKALHIRKQIEKHSAEIDQLQRAIDKVQQKTS